MRLNKFDLNLLVALQALLEERNVTRAADRLNITQSAMSAALRRLRETFNDEILVAHGKKMVPTSHALGIAPLVEQALVTMQALVSSSTVFDPSTSKRTFRLAASDYITTVLIIPLLAELETDAPGIRLEVIQPNSEINSSLDRGVLDFILTPERFLSANHPKCLLFEERHVIVGWNKNPIFLKPITEEVFLSCGHIVVQIGSTQTYAEEQLKDRGDSRRVEIVASSFTIVPWMLPGTHRIALMHERLAKVMLAKLPLTIAPVPFSLPPMREMIQYHHARSTDGGLQWLLGKLLTKALTTSKSGTD